MDAFNTNLHGCRILCQGPFPKQLYPPIMESIQMLREPFKKRILLSTTPFGISKYLPMVYDTIFHIKEAGDWTLFLTYLTYAPKPNLVVSEDIVIPDGLWSKITRQTTFVNFTSAQVVGIRPYDTIFFAPMEDISASYSDYMFKILQIVYRSSYSQKEHKEILQELRVASAGLVWSRVDEDVQGGSVYWYDPISIQAAATLTSNQVADILLILANQMRS